MALTPALAEVGSRLGQLVETSEDTTSDDDQGPVTMMEVSGNTHALTSHATICASRVLAASG